MPVCMAASCTIGSVRMPKGELSSTSPVTGLRTGTLFHRNEWAAARRRCGIYFDSELSECAANLTCFILVTNLHLTEHDALSVLDVFKRCFKSPENDAKARLLAAVAASRTAGRLGSFWLYRAGGCRVSASS